MSTGKPRYKNPALSIETRLKDLLRRMTLEEKVRQLLVLMPEITAAVTADIAHTEGTAGSAFFESKKRELKKGIGQFALIVRGETPAAGAELANRIQKYLIEHSRLGIPAIIHDESLHGCMAKGSTVFPQSIALASTWDTDLMGRVAEAIGAETRSHGITQVLAPTLDIARDPRCGRTEETYGEDPYLVSRMAVAYVRGIQSQGVAASPKHFTANFVGDGGRDSNALHISERLLREIYLPPFEAAIREAGAMSILPGYHASDGVPASADGWLLGELLRDEWKFDGYVVSDYGGVSQIHSTHRVAESRDEAAVQAITAGMDVDLPNSECYRHLLRLVRQGKLSENVIEKSARRVLRIKFRLGLFEDPYTQPQHAAEISDCSAHRQLALEAAQRSIVLLKNEHNALPLKKKLNAIAVIGPSADFPRLGSYATRDARIVLPLAAIEEKVGADTTIHFAKGCDILTGTRRGFKRAVAVARKSDVAILFLGNRAFHADVLNTEGEGNDRSNLDLPGHQEALIDAVLATGTPVVVVLLNGSAVTMEHWAPRVQAIVEAWYPGVEGGTAIADVLFGDVNPGGKLPLTFAIRTGMLPLYYNFKPSGRFISYTDHRDRHADGMEKLLQFPFGHGLSYTTFKYSHLKISKTQKNGRLSVQVSCRVRNIGRRSGDEVVQLYIHDEFASLTRPVKELKRFARITLKPKESRTVRFELGKKDLSFLDRRMKQVLEPGDFRIMIGSSSEDIRLSGTLTI